MTTEVSRGLRVCGLFKSYGRVAVLRGLDLSIPAGSITCLLGRNGAGKTTAMSCILGLRECDAGVVLLDGNRLRRDDAEMHSFGYMPEEPALYEHLTGQEFLEFIGALYRVDQERFAWIDEQFAALDLLESRDRLIREYSLGMKRKISFLAATIHDPKVLVLDEPMGGLDAPSARVLKDQLEIAKSRGRTVLFSTHVMELAERMADQVAILSAGRIVLAGSPTELLVGAGSRTLEDIFLEATVPRAPESPAR